MPLNKKVKSQLNPQTLEHTPKNQEPPHHQIQSCGFSPNPLQLSSSPIAGTSDSFDTQHRGGGLDRISNSVSAVAANLCHCLQLPLLRRRDLVAESREVLVQALRERHGPLLQENLLKVQRRLSFGTGLRAVQLQDKGPSMIGTDGFWPTDAFNTAFQGGNGDQSCFDAQKTGSFKRRRKQKHTSGMSPPQPRPSLDQTAEWMTGPSVEKVGDLLYEILRPCSSSRFCKDFQLSSRASSPNQLFAPAPTSRWAVQASPPQRWDDGFNRATRRESVGLECYENGFLNQTRTVRERSSGPGYSESGKQPFLYYPAGLPEGHPAEPRHFPQEQDPFEIDSRSFVPSSYAQVRYPQERNQLHPFYHFSQPATRPSLLSHHTDMMHYPPSHMLERGPSPPRPSFPSPEHWSFPPMRLY
ncbi:uncharacterized protein [Centroberyx affinis]|uniref:uncharacterized protein n=1 Tax=Centroberyx affinis TaxID=166261 RepID=UPI003A5C2590